MPNVPHMAVYILSAYANNSYCCCLIWNFHFHWQLGTKASWGGQ